MNNGYINVKNIIPKNLCEFSTQYALLRQTCADERTDDLVPDTTSIYGDTHMETFLHLMLPEMEKHTGLQLCPTYSYYRIYKPGDKLPKHRDRESCEISTTICLGFNYKNVADDYRWGIYVEPGIYCTHEPGDCLIYRGCDIEHWRDTFEAGEGSYHVQLFLHYINKNGPFYPEFAHDKRKSESYINDIYVFDDVLSSNICDELVHIIDNEALVDEPDQTMGYNVQAKQIHLGDTKQGRQLYDGIIYDTIKQKVDFLSKEHSIAFYGDSGYNLRKIHGATRKHADGMYGSSDKSFVNIHSLRSISIIIALNSDYEGGILFFPRQKYSVKLKKGQMLAFPPYWTHPHYTNDLKNGTYRYTINTWLLGT